jgi:hypothetical protein
MDGQTARNPSVTDEPTPTHDPIDTPDKRQAARFAAAMTVRDYRDAALIITECVAAGDVDLAALLLEGTLSAAMDAIQIAATSPVITISQTVGDVPAGTTRVGFRADRIG